MKKLKHIFVLSLCMMFMLSATLTSAHSGRTDSYGGHHDYRNVSGLGSYHYHCGGYPPHLHKNGVCPYSTPKTVKKTSSSTSKYYTSSVVKKVQSKLTDLGFKCGNIDGKYGQKTKKAIKKFQKSKHLTTNGKINQTLLKHLNIRI